MNCFSDRKYIVDEYYKWLNNENNKNSFKDCAFTFVTYLEMKNLLKDIKKYKVNKDGK